MFGLAAAKPGVPIGRLAGSVPRCCGSLHLHCFFPALFPPGILYLDGTGGLPHVSGHCQGVQHLHLPLYGQDRTCWMGYVTDLLLTLYRHKVMFCLWRLLCRNSLVYLRADELKIFCFFKGIPLVIVIIVIAFNKDNYGLVTYGRFGNGATDDLWVIPIPFFLSTTFILNIFKTWYSI